MLPCYIVKDLLPSHLEGLTSPRTAEAVERHLAQCGDCSRAREAMAGEIVLETPPARKKNIFRKLRRQQIIGAVLTVVLTLYCLVGLYNLEYCIDLSSTDALEQTIEEAVKMEADFVKMVSVKDRAFVLYREGGETDLDHGVIQFQRGIFGKYRLCGFDRTDWPLTHYTVTSIGNQPYLLISCVNEPVGAETFRIYADFPTEEWFLRGDFDAPLELPAYEPVYEGPAEAELLILHPLTEEQAQARHTAFFARYFDAEGNLLDSEEIAAEYGTYDSFGGKGNMPAQAPVQMYVYMAIVLLIGFVFVRYFLVP